MLELTNELTEIICVDIEHDRARHDALTQLKQWVERQSSDVRLRPSLPSLLHILLKLYPPVSHDTYVLTKASHDENESTYKIRYPSESPNIWSSEMYKCMSQVSSIFLICFVDPQKLLSSKYTRLWMKGIVVFNVNNDRVRHQLTCMYVIFLTTAKYAESLLKVGGKMVYLVSLLLIIYVNWCGDESQTEWYQSCS